MTKIENHFFFREIYFLLNNLDIIDRWIPLQAYVHDAGNDRKKNQNQNLKVERSLVGSNNTYINNTTHNKYTPAEIKLNIPGNVVIVFAYTKLYSVADPNGEIDSNDVVSE